MPHVSRNFALIVAGAVVLLALIGASFWQVFLGEKSGVADESTFAQEYGLAFTDYEGKQVLLSSFRREVLVAYVWASWCPYCGGELENLSKLKNTYGDEVQIVAINRAEPIGVARAYTSPLSVSGLVLLLDPADAFFKEIDGYAMPETVFIDKGGAVIFHQRGPMPIDAVKKKIDELLGR